MKTALVYDRVNKWGGAEMVLLALHKLFPKAPLYTSVYNPKTAAWAKVFPEVVTSFLQKFPLAKTRHDFYPWLMPLVFESFDFSKYDVVISVTSEFAKGIITKPGTIHICYCLTPARYLWSGYKSYFASLERRLLSRLVVSYLRVWDKASAQRPDVMVGISHEVISRMKRYYGRDAELIYPPVETGKFKNQNVKTGEYFLVVSRLVPYKRTDLVIEVFNRLKWPLVVVGTGSGEKKLRRMAAGNVKFVGFVTEKQLVKYYQNCKALIFPQEEDFGIVAVEAQAAGKPVIAYRAGGALDTVVEGKTGVFFNSQTPISLVKAVQEFDPAGFDPRACKKNARRFSVDKFRKNFGKLVSACLGKLP